MILWSLKLILTVMKQSISSFAIRLLWELATSQLAVGDSLPSVRQLADYVGINMHTVNKAYSVLRQEGYIKLDRRKGAVIAIDYDQVMASRQIMGMLQSVLAEAICKNVDREEVHEMVDAIYDSFARGIWDESDRSE